MKTRITSLAFLLVMLTLAACTATQQQAAVNAGVSTGIDYLSGATKQKLILDGAKDVQTVVNTK